jgi:hypothetical protein
MDKTNIEDYLFNIYKSNTRMYKKLYYQKNKKRILDYNNKRYDDRLINNGIKIIKKEFIIKFN